MPALAPAPPDAEGIAAAHVRALRSDLRNAVGEMTEAEVRYMVDLYYQMQEYRKRAANQSRAAGEDAEPNAAIQVILGEFVTLEGAIKAAMDKWTDQHHMGVWAKGHVGIGPVLAAGLLAHIDPTRSETSGGVWRFAGLDPTLKWGKGQKRPYNARLKVLAWKIGDSFVKHSGREGAFYGRLYRERKAQEVRKNEAGDFADQATQTLKDRNIKDKATRERYESGKLPDGRIDLRARRYAVKLFLAHYWEEARRDAGLPVPEPYPIAHMGHVHRIDAPETNGR